jgi:predicted ATPase
MLLEQAERQPVLFILEDVHWTDPSTLELLDLLIDQTPTASILALLTCRPTFEATWSSRSYLTQVTLNRLSRDQIEVMVARVTGGKTLPTEVVQQITEKTDGVPLFVEEITRAVLESGVLKEVDGLYELTGSISTLAIPATLQDSLMARLDRLMTAKVIAQLGATIGRRFTYELLLVVSQMDEATLQQELGRMVEAEPLYQRGLPPQATYTFKHALITDAAYQSLLRSTRQQYHQHVAQVLEAQFPETVETQPELLAYHHTEAGLNEKAVDYWHQAGEKAVQRSAHVEAIHHLPKGRELLRLLPDTPERALQELTLQRTLGVSLLATKGIAAPEVEHAYTRARALCDQVQDTQQIFPVLFGLFSYYLVRGDFSITREFAEQLLALAQRQQDTSCLVEAHFRPCDRTVALYGGQGCPRWRIRGIRLHARHVPCPTRICHDYDSGHLHPYHASQRNQGVCELHGCGANHSNDTCHSYSEGNEGRRTKPSTTSLQAARHGFESPVRTLARPSPTCNGASCP